VVLIFFSNIAGYLPTHGSEASKKLRAIYSGHVGGPKGVPLKTMEIRVYN
jgi:hypothetical protein